MAPEQALAKRVVVDNRADVYSLAVTLYELLTLQAAYTGQDREHLLKQIAFEEPIPPRRIDANIPRELETIILKAMSKDAEDRYASAQELAADLTRYHSDEPIQASPPSAMNRLGKWARRHQPIVLSAFVVMVLATVGSATSAVLINNQRVAKEEARLVATKNFGLAKDAVDSLLTEVVQEELFDTPQLEHVKRNLLNNALRFYQEMVALADDGDEMKLEVALAKGRLGQVLTEMQQHNDALQMHTEAVTELDQLRGDLAADPGVAMAFGQALKNQGHAMQDAAHFAGMTNADLARKNQEIVAIYRRAVDVMREVVEANPVNRELLVAYGQVAQIAKASSEQLIDVKTRLGSIVEQAEATDEQRATLAAVIIELLYQKPDPAELVEQAARQGLALCEALLDRHPRNPRYQRLLIRMVQSSTGALPTKTSVPVEAWCERAHSVGEQLVAAYPSVEGYRFDYALLERALGERLDRKGDKTRAVEQYQSAADRLALLMREYPENQYYLKIWHLTNQALGRTYFPA